MSRRSSYLPKFSFTSGLVAIVFVIVVGFVSFVAGRVTKPKTVQYMDNRSAAPVAKKEQKINKSFNFSVKDSKGAEITQLAYALEDATLQDEIIIKGARAKAIQGKTFLIINFNLTNKSNKYIQLNSRDYIRLKGNNGTLIAPDIHNDPIQIQPISTKESRLGFPVDDTTQTFTLSVGEVDGKKTDVPLNF